MDIAHYMYIFMYTTCTDELYFCVHNSYKRDTHIHMVIGLYIYGFIYIYTVHNNQIMFYISYLNEKGLLFNNLQNLRTYDHLKTTLNHGSRHLVGQVEKVGLEVSLCVAFLAWTRCFRSDS